MLVQLIDQICCRVRGCTATRRLILPVALIVIAHSTQSIAQSNTQSSAQTPPDLNAFQQYDKTVSELLTGKFTTLPEALQSESIDAPFALAQLLLQNKKPELALQLLTNRETALTSSDPRLTYVFRLRAEAWRQLGDKKQTRISEISALEAMRERLGYQHPVFMSAVDEFFQHWKHDDTVDQSALSELIDWLQRPVETEETASFTAESGAVVVPLFYGTNRQRGASSDPAEFYGTRLGNLEVGELSVTIPPGHQHSVLEKPAFWQLAGRTNQQKFIVLADINPLTTTEFSDRCCDEKDKLLLIHGYNVSFYNGALRAAQITYDLEFPGTAHYFSWPSQGSLWGYLSDSNNVVASRPAIIEYLDLLTRTSGRLHIVAHSMGNRYLLEALEIFLRDFPDRQLGKIIFAAPDVDQIEFGIRVQSLYGRVDGMALYSSNNDQALKISRSVNGRARAGDSGATLLDLKDVTSIDVTGLAEDSLGHSYFGDADQVLADMMGFVQLDWSADQRCSLTPRDQSGWKIDKRGCRIGALLAAKQLVEKHNRDASDFVSQHMANNTDDDPQFWQEVLALIDRLLVEDD